MERDVSTLPASLPVPVDDGAAEMIRGAVLPSPEWDPIPGGRGCTPPRCGFRDLHGEFRDHVRAA